MTKVELLKGVVVGGAIAAAAGCSWIPSVGPDYERKEVALPSFALPDAGVQTTNVTSTGEYELADKDADFRVNITTNDIQCWWAHFNDPVLTGLVTESVSNNLSFLMAQHRLTAARWRLLGSYAAYLPHFDMGVSLNGYHNSPNNKGMSGKDPVHMNVFKGGFDATWEIDIFGGSRRQTEASWAEAEAAGWRVADAWVSLTSEVGLQYIALRTTQSRIDVARTNLVFQMETYDILKSRLDSGIGDELAVSQSLYILNRTRSAIPPLLAAEEQIKNSIAILAGTVPGALHETLAPDVEHRDWLLEPAKLAAIPLDMIRARPDVRVAERELAAQVAYVGVAEAQWYPKLFINGSLGLEATQANKFFKRDSFYGAIGPAISWPIFQGGNIYANIKSEEAMMNEKYLNYELAIDKAYGEVRDAYSAYTQEYHRYRALSEAVKAAQDAVNISRDLYKTGLKDFTAVIDAQRSLLELQESLVVSRGQITHNLIALYKSLGGGIVIADEDK